MGIQLYEKKDDICFLFSLGPLQCCPSLKKGLSLLEYIFFVVVEIFLFFFFLYKLYFETRAFTGDNGILIIYKLPLNTKIFSPNFCILACVCYMNSLEILGMNLFNIVKCKQYMF